jgi:hypothetical protein
MSVFKTNIAVVSKHIHRWAGSGVKTTVTSALRFRHKLFSETEPQVGIQCFELKIAVQWTHFTGTTLACSDPTRV